MKQRQLFLKLFILGALLGLFALGLSFVNYIVYEREGYQNQVVREIERNQIDRPTLELPRLVGVQQNSRTGSLHMMQGREDAVLGLLVIFRLTSVNQIDQLPGYALRHV